MIQNYVFERFEDEVIRRILTVDLKDNPDISCQLLLQYKNAEIVQRHFFEQGYYTEFSVLDEGLRLANRGNSEVGNTLAEIPNLRHGIGFLLFIRDGLISSFEGYTFGEKWPESFKKYTLVNAA